MYGVLYAISPEIFPAKDRGTGSGLTSIATRIFGVLVCTLFFLLFYFLSTQFCNNSHPSMALKSTFSISDTPGILFVFLRRRRGRGDGEGSREGGEREGGRT